MHTRLKTIIKMYYVRVYHNVILLQAFYYTFSFTNMFLNYATPVLNYDL